MKYVTISIPEPLAREIDEFVIDRLYSSRAEFAKEAIRNLIDHRKSMETKR